LNEEIKRVLISAEQIQKRIGELAEEINRDYGGEEIIAVGILNGAVIFFADLVRQLDFGVEFAFIKLSSYNENAYSSGKIKAESDFSIDITNKNVLIVEDIIDSGLTLKYLKDRLLKSNVKSVRICCLLDKKTGRKTELLVDYIGFEIEDEYVVGFGLDINQKFRNLKDICVLSQG